MPDTTSPSSQTHTSFTIGAVGHRNVEAVEQALSSQIAVVFRQLNAEHMRERISLLSSFAEGADRLLLATAAELGMQYACVLPCAPDCFREDFVSRESRAEFERLLDAALSVVYPDWPLDKEAGYVWASEAVVDRCDILVAIWNGAPGNGPAGTAGTVARALARGIPVIWVSTEPPHTVRRLEPSVEAV